VARSLLKLFATKCNLSVDNMQVRIYSERVIVNQNEMTMKAKQESNPHLYYIRNGLVCGRVVPDPRSGFRWVPFTTAHQPSRKAWPTPEAAIAGRISGGSLIPAVNMKHACAIARGDYKSNDPQSDARAELLAQERDNMEAQGGAA
jgi:hypothetical protein